MIRGCAAGILTESMKQLLSVPVSGQNFGLSAMTEEIYATFQIESILILMGYMHETLQKREEVTR